PLVTGVQTCALPIFLFSLVAMPSRAQQFAVDWFKISGGGGVSTGAVFGISGTIGQPDAGMMTGGEFGVVGGFWGFIAPVPTPGRSDARRVGRAAGER